MDRCPRCARSEPKVGRCSCHQPESAQDPPGTAGLLTDPSFWHNRQGRRGGRAPSAERHFLVPALGLAIPLDSAPGVALRIGRDPTCELQVASPTVSRRHAEIRFKGLPPRAYLRDLSAVNRTVVNGERITGERSLTNRDVIRVGDVGAVYRLLARGEPDGALLHTRALVTEATIPLVSTEATPDARGTSGDVELFALSEVIGRLTLTRATGTLFVVTASGIGRATFRAGVLVVGSFAGREGADAIRAISEVRQGRFRFDPEVG